ncbi:MAG TPA: hypothetical protein VLH19_03260 [Patescibacteria group bacterium]|nr:hypothetical protein [Patescibacteria group bacterium]
MLQNAFQLPIELSNLSDDEFWEHVEQLDAMAERAELGLSAFSLTIASEQKKLKIPYIRFARNFPDIQS